MLTQEKKQNQIAQFSENFKKAEASFVVQFQGLNAQQVTDLRGQLRSKKAQFKVIRNTLAKRVLGQNEELKEMVSSLSGSNAFVFAFSDASQVAKVLSEFAKDTSVLKLKTGLLNNQCLSAEQVQHLATLPSLDELRQKMLSLLCTPARQLVSTLNEVPASFVRVLNLQSKQSSHNQ